MTTRKKKMDSQTDNTKIVEKKKKKGGRLFFRILIIAVLALFIGATAYTLNARRLVRNAMPMPFGWGASVILSGSMEPTLSVNDLVFVRATGDYEVGDVVVYQSGSSRVIHRIARILEDGSVITKGDANNTEDEPVPAEDVKGEMVGKVPLIGAAVRFLQTPIGIIIVIAVLILLIVVLFNSGADCKRTPATLTLLRKRSVGSKLSKKRDSTPRSKRRARKIPLRPPKKKKKQNKKQKTIPKTDRETFPG